MRIELVKEVKARRPLLWRSCATVEGLQQWQADRVSGRVEAGSSVLLEWPDLSSQIVLDVVRVRNERSVIFQSGDNLLELWVEDGAIRLVHDGLSDDDDIEGFAASWRTALALLGHGVERHRDRARDVVWWHRPVRTTVQSAYTLFTQAEGLRTWLTEDGFIGPTGSDYRLEMRDGSSMSGRVLSHVYGRDLALSWLEEGDSALIMRTLPSPNAETARTVALSLSSWAGAPDGDVVSRLRTAFERLCNALARGGAA